MGRWRLGNVVRRRVPVTLSDPEIVADREALEGSRGQPRGFAFVWRRFEIPDLLAPMLACVMATVPANALIRQTIKAQEEYPRMPEILDDDTWSTWLGAT